MLSISFSLDTNSQSRAKASWTMSSDADYRSETGWLQNIKEHTTDSLYWQIHLEKNF